MNLLNSILLTASTIVVATFGLQSCQPIVDPEMPDIELERHYCNDPFAVNYNDSFPGIPDNDRCFYPQDYVVGGWAIIDSVFRPDGEFIEYDEKDIQFIAVASEEKNQVLLNGWCMSPDKSIELTVNKYGKITIDTHLEFPLEGQIDCGTDTLSGSGNYKVSDDDTTIVFELTERKTTGQIKIHKFTATKI